MTEALLCNRYELEVLIGQGGMAHVYRARDRVLGRPVAIKVLRPEYVSDENLLARFQREARAAAALLHPNIVSVYDVGQDGDQHYIVMEYMAGPTLKEVIRRRAPLPVEQALKVAEQVCAALEYAHRHGVIHRDIKPQNILFSEDEEVVKVADFGIAKSRLDPEITAERLALGTVKYISPEQARGVEVVPQSDLYSLGVVLYEMLTGQQPFTGDTPVSIALQHVEAEPPPPRQFNPYIPPAVEEIVLRCLAKDPRHRFLSAREMRLALERYRLVGAEVTGAIPQPLPIPPGQPATYPPSSFPPMPASRATEVPAYPPYTVPRRPPAPPREAGLGPLGIVLLVLIAAGLVSLLVLSIRFWPVLFPASTPAPTPLPTITATATSTALPQVSVPDLKGLSREEARARLSERGLQYAEAKPVYDPYIEPGHVVSQDPPYGTYVAYGSVVTVTLGAEPGIARVPQVVQYPVAAAEELVRRAGFRVAKEEVGCTSTQAGYVDRQEPRGNIQYLQGLTVTLYVSLGREQTVMPEVRRLPLEEARRQVEEAGLTWGFTQGQTQADMPPGVRIGDLGAPGQVISYRVEFGGRIYSDEQMPPGTRIPCRATIHVAYNATPP